MTTDLKTPDGIYSSKLDQTTTTGTGGGAGLANMGEAMAAAGVTLTNNTEILRALGVESMTISTALASGEQPAGPLLFAVQGQIDRAIAERSARKLAARMAGDGKLIGEDRLRDAIGAACHALVCWRAGVAVERGADGGDSLTPNNTTDERLAARVAWRACVASLSDDTLGDSIPLVGGAEDDWLCAQALPSESRTERAARLWIERHAPKRLALLARRLASVSAGRGRRAAAVERVGNALALMLGGDSMDTAATAAGFARRGRNSAAAGFLRAARRLGLIGEAFTLPRRAKR